MNLRTPDWTNCWKSAGLWQRCFLENNLKTEYFCSIFAAYSADLFIRAFLRLKLDRSERSHKWCPRSTFTIYYYLLDHDLTCTNLNTKRYKSPQRTYHYRNIKSIDLELFEQAILSSSLFSSPDPTVDGYANQMETELTSILDKVAPLKTGHRTWS